MAAHRPHVEVYEDAAGEWRWRMVRSGKTVADGAEGYVKKANALAAVDRLLTALHREGAAYVEVRVVE